MTECCLSIRPVRVDHIVLITEVHLALTGKVRAGESKQRHAGGCNRDRSHDLGRGTRVGWWITASTALRSG